MSSMMSGIFDFADRVQMESLNQRLTRSEVIAANIANAETPGYRSLGYDFEEQLQAIVGEDDPFAMKATNPKHFRNGHTEADGTIYPDVYVEPTESVSADGNTVDIDRQMALLAKNQLKYQAAIELLSRKVGVLKYAIMGGR